MAVHSETPEVQSPVGEEHLDVVILGAGLSGIGAACHLRRAFPDRSLAILEARDAIGGTWDLFRYPGIRSDSDMFTMGYSFRPWQDARGIADGPSILGYVRDTARAYGVEQLIRFGHRGIRASWSSEQARWTVTAQRTETGEEVTLTCNFLYMCTGYYRYDEGYNPGFAGTEDFSGEIVHPQHWPAELDVSGKRVVVIGSGATAVTLVPSLVAEGAEHVTMLQRSPTYIVPIPARDRMAAALGRWISPRRAYALVRWRNVLMMILIFQLCRRAPGLMRSRFLRMAAAELPEGFDVETHLSPSYNPWDQRVCMAADGDFFQVLREGSASIVTATLECFTTDGVRLTDGTELGADVIVTATGLRLMMLGGLEIEVDGEPVEVGSTVAYKGMMLCGIPNLAFAIGYTNASWTLKADLVAEYVCRLLAHMSASGRPICVPRNPRADLPQYPILDLKSGYVLRSMDALPKQAGTLPWRLHQNYIRDIRMLRHGPVDDEIDFRLPSRTTERPELAAAA
ncbi:MAG TPA: NAD(P)/FAD-dependent oxidoreductase [Solirubrobacteraceae bacterium]|nr:NAD(P)/FAD-dependent oxidoreductase [Solirubrobacteraceae bacterium]